MRSTCQHRPESRRHAAGVEGISALEGGKLVPALQNMFFVHRHSLGIGTVSLVATDLSGGMPTGRTVSLVAADLSGGTPTGRVLRLYKEPWGAQC